MKKEKIVVKNKAHLEQLIQKEVLLKGNTCNLNHLDTSLITDMSHLFHDSKFNGDISQWNTSHVRNMYGMFAGSLFNKDISDWNVSNVSNMSFMFAYSKFNRNISDWNVCQVAYMINIFKDCKIEDTPYWAKIEGFFKRKKSVREYQEMLRNKDILENLIASEKTAPIIHKI